MNRRGILKAFLAAPVAAVLPTTAEGKCIHPPVHTSPEGGLFRIRYIGPNTELVPRVMVKTTNTEHVDCDKCGLFYTDQKRVVYNAQERFSYGGGLAGYNVVPAGGQWVIPCLGDDVVQVEGKTYNLAELDREREWDHYTSGYVPKEYSVRILETKYHTVKDYSGSYEVVSSHKLQVAGVGTIPIDPYNRPLNTHHYDKSLPINPDKRSGNHRLDFAGEEYKVQLPEWWVNEHKV